MSLINKTEVSLEEELKKASAEEARIREKLDHIEDVIEQFKLEGRTGDVTFAFRVLAVWLDSYLAQVNYVKCLNESIKDKTYLTFCDVAKVWKKASLRGMAKLTIANRTLYNEIIGCNITEQDLDSLKRLAEGK